MGKTRIIAIASFVFSCAFFYEYLAASGRHIKIPFDLEGFHYPLADQCYRAVRQGRIPEWDATIYCGIPFAANVQAAFYYPGTWILFAANAAHERLRFGSVQDFVLLHVWFAFFLCYLWLKRCRLHPLAAVIGAGAYAFSGYSMTVLQHLGQVIAYAWMPLGFMGIDEARQTDRWRPLWKTAVASALCFLGGYPSMWVVFAVCAGAYSLARVRLIVPTALALLSGLLLAGVQVVPAWAASGHVIKDIRYGGGFEDLRFYLSYIAPNYFNFGLDVPVETNVGFEYLYVGALVLIGLAAALFALRAAIPGLLMLAGAVFFFADPTGLLTPMLTKPSLFSGLIRDWNFMAGIAAAYSVLTAVGLDVILSRKAATGGFAASTAATVAALGWSAWLLYIWIPGGREFEHGAATFVYPLVSVVIAVALLWAFRRSSHAGRVVAAAAILLLAGAEYKAFGTSKRFNARTEEGWSWAKEPFPGLDSGVYREMIGHPEYRVALDFVPLTADLRHTPLRTPQGFDPLLPVEYRDFLAHRATFRSDREFNLGPADADLMRLFGVRYYLTWAGSPNLPALNADPKFRFLGKDDKFFKPYELRDALPSYRFPGEVTAEPATPERRPFRITSTSGGTFKHIEQYFEGWSASIDGAPAPIERCGEVFQCVQVPAGSHSLVFTYYSTSLRAGAAVSALSILLLGIALWRTRPSPPHLPARDQSAQPPVES